MKIRDHTKRELPRKLPTWGVMLTVPELETTRKHLTHSTDAITTAARKKVEEVLKVAKL